MCRVIWAGPIMSAQSVLKPESCWVFSTGDSTCTPGPHFFASISHSRVPIWSMQVRSGAHTGLERLRHLRKFKSLPSECVERHGIKAINRFWIYSSFPHSRTGESTLTCPRCLRLYTTCAISLPTYCVSIMQPEPPEPLLVGHHISTSTIQAFIPPTTSSSKNYLSYAP
jgi:hypothetical protein